MASYLRTMPVSESAPAKVNLTLSVLGRRTDGYHELSSLVAFARIGDRLDLHPGEELSLVIEGPFAGALNDDANLVLEAARLVSQRCPDIRAGAFTLHKELPVASGLGGGSADAAAALRLLDRANHGLIDPRTMTILAAELGSDVSVCMKSSTAIMGGRGDKLTAVPGLSRLSAVLVNPGVELSTAQVFEALGAGPLDGAVSAPARGDPVYSSVDDLVRYLRGAGNDLEAPAVQIRPVIAQVLKQLSVEPGCRLARMSGSGPTCFGVFPDNEAAEAAAQNLARERPDWWVVATELG